MIEFRILRDFSVTKVRNTFLVAGIDEAGRGPVIGPMIMAGIEISASDVIKLIKLGVKDSKSMSKDMRERIFKNLLKIESRIAYAVISPSIIDEWIIKKNGLNALEAFVVSELILKFFDEARYIFVDAPSTEKSYRRYIQEFLDEKIKKVFTESQADKVRPIVSAASIIAKTIRELEIERIKKDVKIDFGSGYPSDPRTRKALPLLLKKAPHVVRYSWKTLKKIA